MAYDSKCYDLAEHFLADEPSLNNVTARRSLAQFIQTAVEGEIAWMHDHIAELGISKDGDTVVTRRTTRAQEGENE